MSNSGYDLPFLARALATAKDVEKTARDARIRLEEQVAALVPFDMNKQKQKTIKLGNGGKVTVKRGYNYQADCEAIKRLYKAYSWPAGTRPAPPPIETKDILIKKGYEWYREYQPDVFKNCLAPCVTVTPAKVSVTVQPPGEEDAST